MTNQDKLQKQMLFLIEADKMKNILRQTLLTDQSRQETDAEHSWHFALMAMTLFEYASPDVDMLRVLKMALVHDLVEIYAGDTFAYDEKGYQDKLDRETAAADRLFGMLPPEQGAEYRALWEEFDEMKTPDAVYAASIDRLQPFINNYITQGYTWKLGDVSSDRVYQRMDPVRQGLPELWAFVQGIINDSIDKGYLKK